MPSFSEELLTATRLLLARRQGARGRLSDARIRRAISTAYYAIFHFAVENATIGLVGTGNALRTRRRALARSFTHAGLRTTFEKLRGANINASVAHFFVGHGLQVANAPTPAFARQFANVFLDALSKREEADYDRNVDLGEQDAHILTTRVEDAIRGWIQADGPAERDLKNAIYTLLVVRGQLKP
jgi:uncharacterized protein (UPF0332 family)